MKKITTILFILMLSSTGFGQLTWTTQITPDNSSEMATKLIKTQDGGFLTVLSGVDPVQNIPQNIFYNKIAIVKLDNTGDTVFYKKISIKDSTSHNINDFIELPTGEFLLSGDLRTVTANDTTFGSLLVKTNNIADTLWTKINYGYIGTSYSGYNLVDFATKFWTVNAILTGPFDTLNYFIHEYDYNGNLLNVNYQDTMVLYNSFSMKPNLFKDINDSVLVLAEWKDEGLLYKKMDTLWNTFNLSSSSFMGIKTVISANGNMADGGNDLFIVTGQMDSIWHHAATEYEFSWGAGTSQANMNICTTSDGGYAMIGDTWNAIVNNIYLIKTDAMGNKQFGEMYWSVTTHNIDVVQANDGGYVMMNTGTGYWNTNGAGIWIVKTDQNGIIGVDENEFLKNEVLLYPNPAKDKVTIKLAQPSDVEIFVYSITGKQVLSKKVVNGSNFLINIKQLPQGMYIVQLKIKDTFITKKLIKH